MKWLQKKVRGWIVPFWYTDTPLFFVSISAENKEIGTVEPNFKKVVSKDKIAFVVGAIEKYGNNKEYYKSLMEYLKGQLK